MHWTLKLLLEFTGAFNFMLLGGAVLSFLGYGLQNNTLDRSNLYLGVVLILVVLLTGTMSFYQQ